MKLKKKSMKSKKILSTLLVTNPFKLKKNLTPLDIKFKILKTNSKPIFLTPMTIISLLKKFSMFIRKLMNTMSNFRPSKLKLNKTLNSKTCLNLNEEIINLSNSVFLIWKILKSFGILLLWLTFNIMIGKENYGDKLKLTILLNKTKYSLIKSKVFLNKSDLLKDGQLLAIKSLTWLLY